MSRSSINLCSVSALEILVKNAYWKAVGTVRTALKPYIICTWNKFSMKLIVNAALSSKHHASYEVVFDSALSYTTQQNVILQL
ncbi:unnamed protein product [Didymodactylos carnosus]|uniref:Uncharacterized protein n=1 Tax=Didymodactylos carnosus TaxID=1234261 RepID=A0A814A7D1_9BILA|nr:unnamed protein product [Didymodactylos carnosus]CAF3691853.1 unnamed protein product [Didymodactylos carnosus]